MPLKIVYLDDEQDLCEVFEDNFGTMSGIQLRTFADSASMIKAIESDPADLMFFDFRLVGETGMDVAKKLKNPPPIALISGDMYLKFDVPIVRLFGKPLDFSQIEAFIQSHINAKNSV